MEQAKRQEQYKLRLVYLHKIEKVLEKVINGMSESQACYEEGMNLMTFRNFVHHTTSERWEINENVNEIQTETWKDDFMNRILSTKAYVLPDFDQAFETALSILTEREQYMLNAYYPKGFTLEEIGKQLHMTREGVRGNLSRIYRKIQASEVVMDNFRFGCEAAKIKQIHKQQERIRQQEELAKQMQQHIQEITHRSPSSINLLEEVSFSTRVYNALITNIGKQNCTLDKLSQLTIDEIRKWHSVGETSIREICRVLKDYGVILQG